MIQDSNNVRTQTIDLMAADTQRRATPNDAQLVVLIQTWLTALAEEDLADIAPESLASILWETFGKLAVQAPGSGHIEPVLYADGRGGSATALLIVNQDMPFLIDSIVIAMRTLHIASRAVLNTVLSVRRDADSRITHVERALTGTDPHESYVLCLLSDALTPAAQAALIAAIRMVTTDAAAVHRDAAALNDKLLSASIAPVSVDTEEVNAFLQWAGTGGFEPFGYAYYRITAGVRALQRDVASRLGVLQDTLHPVYGTCLAGIPEDSETVIARASALSVVKADTHSTLHRDQQLDFIGVRDTDASGLVVGEHCFVGLFTRAAAATPLAQLPFARGRIKQILALAGVRQDGFRAEKFREILESLPRTEVLEGDPEWLASVCGTVVALYKQPRAKVFARPDMYGRHLNVLVYMPRERYSASLAATLAHGVRGLSGASEVVVQTLLSDGPLARVYFIAHGARANLNLVTQIQQPLLAVIDGWHTAFDHMVDAAPNVGLRADLRQLASELPSEYLATTSPQAAYLDLVDLLAHPAATRVRVRIEVGMRDAVTIRLLSSHRAPSLSQILPALHNAGVAIDREQTHTLDALAGKSFFVTCLSVDTQSAIKLAQPHVLHGAQLLFESLLNNEAEDGRMNALVIEAGLHPKEVQVLRAYASYWRQAGCRFSLRYMADRLKTQPVHVRSLVDYFSSRFNPAATSEQRTAATDALAQLRDNLDDVNHADTEDILRSLADLMLATLRTSYFQSAQADDTILLKFDSSALALLPQPRPYREIFVFSRRFEGVHLRGGPVARGGLRWSDRMEDYRTEVLGLLKAQMVKNAVIVPAGAKGGFVCKMVPKDATREIIAREGEAVYRLFIAGLLDLTDNRLRDEIIAPPQTVCYDDADPYLVVAADKGTATFSDIANGIAVERGFWLGDAFASGGSNGYDHKKLGITAKGAWEAVKRHFHEIGHDLATTPITMVGVGDMSGDVFGNGVLLSRQLKLVAAFDHRHIFIDPTPDVMRSFAERKRLFALPRSSWDDYDRSLISEGGGVWPRSARHITLSPQACAALGTEATVLTPEQLLHTILLAPVDLFYNGGIGTYIKATTESHAQVKDRANDMIRVNGNQLRCKVVAEGGNLGATQTGRIEFASNGGHIFTDAIDNSAGVDCSDHEVNVKIWLDTEVNAGTLSAAERNRALNDITVDIEALVLRDNRLQTHLLVREAQAQHDSAVQDGYAMLITALEAEGLIDRELEQLPTEAELVRRKADGRGLTSPELAVVIAYVKNRYKRILALQTLTDKPWARTLLAPYFPAALVATRDPLAHPLANAILATVLANEAVNRCGPLMLPGLARLHLVSEAEVVSAWATAWAALNLAPVFSALDADALNVPRVVSQAVDGRTRALLKAVIEGVLSVSDLHASGIDELERLFHHADAARQFVPEAAVPRIDLAATPTAFAHACHTVEAIEGMADFLFAALTVPRPAAMGLPALLQLGTTLRRQTGIDRLERVLTQATVSPVQEALRSHALNALRGTQKRLLAEVAIQVAMQPPAGTDTAVLIAAITSRLTAGVVTADASDPQTLEHAVLQVWLFSEATASAGAG